MTRSVDSALGIYISIPFCRSKCTYCNFASGVYPASEHGRYVERVIEDLRGAARWAAGMELDLPSRADTVYLGGGTPSLLEPELLTALFTAVRASFDLDPDAEITMECAPGQLSDAMLAAMAACGVNRVSLGVQSFIDREAQVSGRLHSRAVVESDLRRLRAAGIANLNVDLIAGLAGQTLASWEQSLDTLLAADAPHASVYMLEIDEDSRLGREMLAGGARYYAELVPTDDAIAQMYQCAIERLDQAGLAQYEISNFSRPGFDSRHNLRYWQRRPYLGVGLDASSALYESHAAKDGASRSRLINVGGHDEDVPQRLKPAKFAGHCGTAEAVPFQKSTYETSSSLLRAKTTDNLAEYLAGPKIDETSWLSHAQQFEEAWFLGLRLNAGVELAALECEFSVELMEPALRVIGQLADDGLVTTDGERVRLTPRGRLLSNDVFQEFIGLAHQHVSQ